MTNLATLCDSKPLYIFATGTIESAIFPLGPDSSEVFCRYEIVTGSNWEYISGINKGISQAAMPKHANDKIVFNLPFECVYKSSNLFGWPQILVSIYAKNRWSVETTLGYCWSHFPIIGSDVSRTSKPIRIPKDTSIMGELFNWITSKNPELKNPKTLLDCNENRESISMEKIGELTFSLRTLYRGTNEALF